MSYLLGVLFRTGEDKRLASSDFLSEELQVWWYWTHAFLLEKAASCRSRPMTPLLGFFFLKKQVSSLSTTLVA
jgi:hypothetical protein